MAGRIFPFPLPMTIFWSSMTWIPPDCQGEPMRVEFWASDAQSRRYHEVAFSSKGIEPDFAFFWLHFLLRIARKRPSGELNPAVRTIAFATGRNRVPSN